MPKAWVYALCAVVVTASVLGCVNTPKTPLNESLLNRAAMTSESIVFDIYFVRFPFGDDRANQSLWTQVDEQTLSTEARRWFGENGLRAGVVAGHVSQELAELLDLDDKPAPCDQAEQGTQLDLLEEPMVVRRHMQLPLGTPGEIIASGIYEELPLLQRQDNNVCGETYTQAQALFTIKAVPLEDGRVRVQLVPEIRHGEEKQQWIGRQGMLRPVMERQRRVFDDPSIETVLAPGHMLLLSSIPSRPGTLGHYFFTKADGGKKEQKLMVIRLTQTQHDELFDKPAVIATNAVE